MASGGNEEHSRPKQEEPFIVEDCLRNEVGHIIPPIILFQSIDFSAAAWYTCQQQCRNQQMIENEFFYVGKAVEPAGEVVGERQKIEVGEEHPAHKHGVVGAVGDVHEVEHQAGFEPETRVTCATAKGHDSRVDGDGAAHFDGNGPYLNVEREVRIAAGVKDETEVFEGRVPEPEILSKVVFMC